MIGGRNLKAWLFTSIFLLGMVCPAAAGKIIYVDADAPGANNGSNWDDAYNYLQDALSDANSATKPVEVRVAQGIYTPDSNSADPNGSGDRTATFQLINGVILKGGYAGFGGLDPNVRDIEIYETILSGDLDGNDIDISDPCDLLTEATRTENSYHVVTTIGTNETAALDGFTITAGNAKALDVRHGFGGGIYSSSSSPTVTNCNFSRNAASLGGGGMYNVNSIPTVTNCVFSGNSGKQWGGGMYNGGVSSPVLTNCTVSDNLGYVGGGIYSTGGQLTLNNCTVIRNIAYHGGGLRSYGINLTLRKCVFSNNSADSAGGAIDDGGRSNMEITKCIFSGNSASSRYSGGGGIIFQDSCLSINNTTFSGNRATEWGGGIYCPFPLMPSGALSGSSAGLTTTSVMLTLNNCILWENSDSGGEDESAQLDVYITPIVNYNCIQGWTGTFGGIGNIDADPCFAEPGYWDENSTLEDTNDDFWVDGDYHLKSQAGRWDANEGRWTRDEVTSLCIDAGDPLNPIGLEPFPNGGIINMGAYGGTAEASKSYFGEPVCEIIVAGDLNGDCRINFLDFQLIALHWLRDENK